MMYRFVVTVIIDLSAALLDSFTAPEICIRSMVPGGLKKLII